MSTTTTITTHTDRHADIHTDMYCTHMHTHIRTYTCTHMCTDTDTCTHTHISGSPGVRPRRENKAVGSKDLCLPASPGGVYVCDVRWNLNEYTHTPIYPCTHRPIDPYTHIPIYPYIQTHRHRGIDTQTDAQPHSPYER